MNKKPLPGFFSHFEPVLKIEGRRYIGGRLGTHLIPPRFENESPKFLREWVRAREQKVAP